MRYLALILLMALIAPANGQPYKNPESYLREFQKENRRLRIKNLRYQESVLKGEDERKVAKYREMVLEQAKESKKAVERIGPYDDYDVLQREYVQSMQMYIDAFGNNFGVAESLSANKFNSYEDLKKYYTALEKAEQEMLDASYRIEKAEEHFARNNYLTIERDPELEQQFAKLDEVTLYSRDMTPPLFRVEAPVRAFLEAAEKGNTDTLSAIVSHLRKAIITSAEEVEEYASVDGNKSLYRQMQAYLEEMKGEVNDNLPVIAEKLANEYLEQEELEDTRSDLDKFTQRHATLVEDFYETRTELILDYLPEE